MKVLYSLIFLMLSFIGRAQIPPFNVTVYDSTLAKGYYFLAIGSTNLILDSLGNAVYYKDGAPFGYFRLHSNGLMSYSNGQGFYLMDSTFTIVDSVEVKNLDDNDFHEFQILPNGHFVLLGHDIEIMDLSSYFWKGHYGNDSAEVRCGVIQEQDANHNVVFEWHAKDHFSFSDADTFALINGPSIKWTHCNAIELDTDGNYLLSSRNFDEITKISRADSSVLWRLGGNQNQFTFVNCPVPFYLQHDIRRIRNGHITLFDNGNNYIPHAARGLEFELDEVNKIATLVWSYSFDSTSFSLGQGNMQRLEGARTLINIGACPNDTTSFVVVDSLGTRLFELDNANIYRAYSYSSLPWKLHRPQITCFDSSGVTYLDAGVGYASYAWSNGAVTRIIPVPAVVDTYYVFVPYGQGGFISSERFVVSNTTDICGTVSILERNAVNAQMSVFPNPATRKATLNFFAVSSGKYQLNIIDVFGQNVLSSYGVAKEGINMVELDIDNIAKGVYLLGIVSGNYNEQIRFILE